AAIGEIDAVDDAGGRGDQLKVEFALQSFGDDLQVQEPEETTAETKAESRGAFRLVAEAGIIQAQPRHRLAQVLELRSICRKQTAEYYRLGRLEAGQGRSGGVLVIGDGVTDAGVSHLL